MVDKRPTTVEAAREVGIHLATLQRWIATKKLKAPWPIIRRGRAVRLWSPGALARLRQVKERIYRRGRGRKKKTKA
jgi:hypothetical protein